MSGDKNRKPLRLLLINSPPDFCCTFSCRHYDAISEWESLRKMKVNVIEIHFNIPVAICSFCLHSFCLMLIKYFMNNLQVGFQVSRINTLFISTRYTFKPTFKISLDPFNICLKSLQDIHLFVASYRSVSPSVSVFQED